MVCVTGGTGLVGSHLLVELVKKNYAVRAIYRTVDTIEVTRNLFEYYFETSSKEKFEQIEWVQGDILDVPSLLDAFKGCKTVYHCAGFVSFSRKDFSTLIKVNRTGTANVVNICLHYNIENLVHVSSTAAIGKFEKKEIYTEDEKWKPGDKVSGYSISKFSAEKEVWRGMAEGLNVSIVNPSIILGPGDWNSSSLKLFKTVKGGLKFYTEGANNFVDARDVVKAMIFLSENNIYGERFLIAGHHLSYYDLFNKIAIDFNKKPPKYKAGKALSKVAWRLSSFFALITGKKPLLTKASVNASLEKVQYSSEKYLQRSNATFYSPKETIQNSVYFFNQFQD